MAVQYLQPHRFTVDQYRRMTEIGVVPEGGTELIDGVIVAGTRWHRFSSSDFFLLGREGILDEDDRVELIDGEIVDMSPIGPRHSKCVSRLNRLLSRLVGEADLRIQDVLQLTTERTVHPDAAVYRPSADGYEERQPKPADALLIVEVADTSLLYDRTVKMEDYATAGVQEYWVIDLQRNVVIVSQKLVAGQFMDVREYASGDTWQSPALGGAEIDVADIIGKRQPG